MLYLHVIGTTLPEPDMLHRLYAHKHRLVLKPQTQDAAQGACVYAPSVLVLACDGELDGAHFGALLHWQAISWIGWNTAAPARTRTAYAAGARAVLPAAMTGTMLLHALQPASATVVPRRICRDWACGARIAVGSRFTLLHTWAAR